MLDEAWQHVRDSHAMSRQKLVKARGKTALECDRFGNEIVEGIVFVYEMCKNVLLRRNYQNSKIDILRPRTLDHLGKNKFRYPVCLLYHWRCKVHPLPIPTNKVDRDCCPVASVGDL